MLRAAICSRRREQNAKTSLSLSIKNGIYRERDLKCRSLQPAGADQASFLLDQAAVSRHCDLLAVVDLRRPIGLSSLR